ncbi:pyridoxal phosphate-dependent aminotransferase [Helicobacter canis]|uniref:pyridoxal phosphate-dependent aminotransferase n=1 Tax=Helicobacter canis TaxID=29419 RepID=UPI0026F358EF|nr:pyridoxal phosphate-dependent aminotransferase [Helicobacter canis]
MTYSSRITNLQESATIAISTLATTLKAQGRDILSFSAGEPDFDTPEPIKLAAKAALDQGFTKYTQVAGIPELKQAIANKLERENGLRYESKQILVSNGAKQSLFNVFQALIDKGDEVIIPAPYWVTYPELVTYSGGSNVFIETNEQNGFKITAKSLRQAITSKTKALVLTTPSNPTGMVYTKQELESIAQVLQGSSIVVIADEMYEKLLYDGEFVSVGSISQDMFERTITINGLSKSVAMTGWRMGYCACADSTLIKLMTNLQSQCTSNINSITQKASIIALEGGVDTQIESMRQAFLARRDLAVAGINQIKGLRTLSPQGAFYLFISIGNACGGDSMEFCKQLLEQEGVALVPGSAFGMDSFVRLSFACSSEQLSQGIERIARFMEGVKGV